MYERPVMRVQQHAETRFIDGKTAAAPRLICAAAGGRIRLFGRCSVVLHNVFAFSLGFYSIRVLRLNTAAAFAVFTARSPEVVDRDNYYYLRCTYVYDDSIIQTCFDDDGI